jgi:hypothetical protein
VPLRTADSQLGRNKKQLLKNNWRRCHHLFICQLNSCRGTAEWQHEEKVNLAVDIEITVDETQGSVPAHNRQQPGPPLPCFGGRRRPGHPSRAIAIPGARAEIRHASKPSRLSKMFGRIGRDASWAIACKTERTVSSSHEQQMAVADHL